MSPGDLVESGAARARRAVAGISALLLMILSVVVPHVAVQAATVVPGRSLIAATNFFLNANPNAAGFAGAVSAGAAGLAITVSYMGLALQEFGLIAGVMSFWVLMAEDVGRWTRRLVMVSGFCLVLGGSTVVLGFQLLTAAGVPSYLGVAWLPTVAAGVIMLVGGRLARRRLTSTWYWENAELVQP